MAARLYHRRHIHYQNNNRALLSFLLVLLSFSFLFFSAHAGLSLPKKAKTKTKKPKAPHIVVIMVDDVGVQDVGYNAG
jgi:hypothetical protein